MNHSIRLYGFSYKLRPVTADDAQFIVDTRLEDAQKSEFVHKISPDVNLQKKWLEEYFNRENDYYFVIENLFTGNSEGLISIYNIENNKAEWGRWVLKRGSFAALESVNLIYKIAFEKLPLEELYTRTVENNISVVNFHKSINAKFRRILENEFELNNKTYNAIEQFVDKNYYYTDVKNKLEEKSRKLFERNMKNLFGQFKFHHFGVATSSIEKALQNYPQYDKVDFFEDKVQGVKGLFIKHESNPTLELLENLNDSHTLDYYLKNNIKIYHSAYYVSNIEKVYKYLIENLNAKIVSDMKISAYFKKRICFLMLKNKEMIELIEE